MTDLAGKVSVFDHQWMDAQAGLPLCCLQTPKTGFLASKPTIYCTPMYLHSHTLEYIGAICYTSKCDRAFMSKLLNQ